MGPVALDFQRFQRAPPARPAATERPARWSIKCISGRPVKAHANTYERADANAELHSSRIETFAPTMCAPYCIITGTRIDELGGKSYTENMGRRAAAGGTKATTAPVTRVVAYVRVSTDKQADEGVSLDAQKAQLAAYASLYSLEIVEVVVDAGESAKSLARPGLARAMAMLATGHADGLLVTKLDRLTRSVRDLGELIAGPFAKAALLSVSEQIDTRSAAGRLVLNVLASVSQWEREAIGERTSVAMQHMRASGEYTGGRVPYGWTLTEGGKLREVDGEQGTIARAKSLREAGLSLAKVATALAAEGRHARNGREFFPQQIANMTA